jgi:lysophospholipase L1-like esterase
MKRSHLIGALCAAILSFVTLSSYAGIPTFLDVPADYWAFTNVETLADSGITSGCGNGNYCPKNQVKRAEMAVFLERGMQLRGFNPGPGTGIVFSDVPASYWAGGWIERLADDGITAGCGGGNYCPENNVTREQMAVFLLRAKHGSNYKPPAPSGLFNDVVLSHWSAGWIEQLAVEGITGGCGNDNYCPKDPVTRDQMAVFLVKTFDLRVGFNEALFAEPTVSSTTQPERQYQANDGIDSVDGNGWAGIESVGAEEAWIQLDFDSPKEISLVVLTDTQSQSTQLLGGRIKFSDGSTVPINGPLPDDGSPHYVELTNPKQTDSIRIEMTDAIGIYALAEVAAYSQGNADGWTENIVVCQDGSEDWDPTASLVSGAGNQYQQKEDCRGYNRNGVELGTYTLQGINVPAGMDLRLRLRSDSRNQDWLFGAMGVLFGYQDDNNYYRLDLSQAEGHRKLYKKEPSSYTELHTSPQSYTREEWVNLRVVHHNGVIQAYVNGRKVLAFEDSTFNAGKIALFCARNESCFFDNVVLLSKPSAPIVGVNIEDSPAPASGEYFVSAGDSLSVVATVTESTGFDRVEFVLDEGPGETSVEDFTVPYSHIFNTLGNGDHTIHAYLLDGNGQRLDSTEAVMELPQVGTGGVHLVGLGNSIAGGLRDDINGDDTSLDGRNTSGGYQTVLNYLMSADKFAGPVTVLAEGNAGETTAEGLARIGAVLARNPEAQGFLLLYGANDARNSGILDSGLGLNPGDPGYDGSFKDYIEQMFSAILDAGKQVYPGKALPKFSNGDPDDPSVVDLNDRLQEFNQVIDELLVEKGLDGSYTAPDFYAYFIANPGEMNADGVHPNGTGYQSLARGWCESLNGNLGLTCKAKLF